MSPEVSASLVLLMCLHVQWGTITGKQMNTCTICACNNDTYHVNCSFTNLNLIPVDPTNKTVLLNMTSTKLFNVNNANLSTYKQLKVLDLYNTSLTSLNVADDAFHGLDKLQHLNLSSNELLPFTNNNTPIDLFCGLNNLTELRIYGNTGTYNHDQYPGKALQKIPNLNELWIDGITDLYFGEEFQSMTSLKKIIIPGDLIYPPWRFCNVENLTNGMFDNLTHVTHFVIRRCGIKSIQPEVFSQMKNLQYLDLSFNTHLTIDGASKGFSGLNETKLEVLVLNSVENSQLLTCGITFDKNIASKFGQLKYLKELHVENDAINGFYSGAIGKLPKSLERIYASKNEYEIGFYTFEAYFLPNLSYLDISHNFFTDDTTIWHNNNEVSANKLTCKESPTREDKNVDSTDEHGHIFSSTELESVVANIIKTKNRNHDMIEHFTKFMERDRLFRSGKLQHHVKNEDSSVCPNRTEIPPATITANLPAKLEYTDLSFSKIAYPIPECYFNTTNVIKKVNASNSLIYCWDGPIHGVTGLEYVDLSYNFCTDVRRSFFDSAPNLKYLSIGFNLLYINIQSDTTGRMLQELDKLETLNISYNRIEKLPSKFLTHQGQLKILNASFNLLKEFEIEIHHMVHIRLIDLYKNHISRLSKEMRIDLETVSKKSYKENGRTVFLNLAENPIQCDCNNIEFLKWIQDHMMSRQFLNVSITQCIYFNQSELHFKSLGELTNIINRLSKHCTSYTNIIIISIVVLFIVFNIIVGVLVHRFRWKIRYWYYVASRNIKTRHGYVSLDSHNSMRYKYDVYIVSQEDIREFVLGKMKKKLESRNFRLFIQDDDPLPNQNLYSCIANAVHVSRTVMFVISATCEDSDEWKIAMRMAHEESLRRREPVFFGVFMDMENDSGFSSDIHEIKKRACIDYPGDSEPEHEEAFWEDCIEKIESYSTDQMLSTM